IVGGKQQSIDASTHQARRLGVEHPPQMLGLFGRFGQLCRVRRRGNRKIGKAHTLEQNRTRAASMEQERGPPVRSPAEVTNPRWNRSLAARVAPPRPPGTFRTCAVLRRRFQDCAHIAIAACAGLWATYASKAGT